MLSAQMVYSIVSNIGIQSCNTVFNMVIGPSLTKFMSQSAKTCAFYLLLSSHPQLSSTYCPVDLRDWEDYGMDSCYDVHILLAAHCWILY